MKSPKKPYKMYLEITFVRITSIKNYSLSSSKHKKVFGSNQRCINYRFCKENKTKTKKNKTH